MRRFPMVPGAEVEGVNPRPGYGLGPTAVNKSGASLSGGNLVVLEITPANFALGLGLPVTTTTSAALARCFGAVPDDDVTIPDGAAFLPQVEGYCELYVDNSGGALAAGDYIGSGTAAGVGAKVADRDNAVGIYLDAAYNSATAAKKKVLLINPLGLKAD